jgi:ADP-dependent phosphofructokinase/glucokinase
VLYKDCQESARFGRELHGPGCIIVKGETPWVLISAIQLCTELCKASKDALEYLRKVRASISYHKAPTNISIELQVSIQKKTGIRSFICLASSCDD